jgi:acetylornithine/N-succinyldiaminopimelate aminotransferase
MKIEKDNRIKLKSFLGTLSSKDKIKNDNDYWKLIGEKGKVINDVEVTEERVLVLFDKNLDDFKVANHNPIKNSLWIKKTDLEIQ